MLEFIGWVFCWLCYFFYIVLFFLFLRVIANGIVWLRQAPVRFYKAIRWSLGKVYYFFFWFYNYPVNPPGHTDLLGDLCDWLKSIEKDDVEYVCYHSRHYFYLSVFCITNAIMLVYTNFPLSSAKPIFCLGVFSFIVCFLREDHPHRDVLDYLILIAVFYLLLG